MKTFICMLVVLFTVLLSSCSKPSAQKYASQWCAKYKKGIELMKEKKFDEANASFEEMEKFYTETSKKFKNDRKFMEEFQHLTRDCKNTYGPERK
jgi:outer membrane protein assembly factor BamD (BamD/ComL family)